MGDTEWNASSRQREAQSGEDRKAVFKRGGDTEAGRGKQGKGRAGNNGPGGMGGEYTQRERVTQRGWVDWPGLKGGGKTPKARGTARGPAKGHRAKREGAVGSRQQRRWGEKDSDGGEARAGGARPARSRKPQTRGLGGKREPRAEGASPRRRRGAAHGQYRGESERGRSQKLKRGKRRCGATR